MAGTAVRACHTDLNRQSRGMTDPVLHTITTVLRRAPEWVRHDLVAKDAGTRERAEEALAAMIAAALHAQP